MMIRILMVLMAILLLFCSYYLIQKSDGLLALLAKTPANKNFLRHYGLLYAALGIVGFFIAIINHSTPSMVYIIVVILFAALFSIQLAQKTKSS
ncbi:hypothetical protein JZO70_10995 [Enterococcus sp. 669A]|uniref:DUF3784 domain-containing protein n=1 Tax=Candidatus Enterococcus moelleringii TaxID=2815325 RepID=A0ABS3LAP8_9ENTE|nr:hypothetical protein [Enterococcus sp. 669A]MBO1306692.1 hypothetical protein [Enterococcus sp. 669A]